MNNRTTGLALATLVALAAVGCSSASGTGRSGAANSAVAGEDTTTPPVSQAELHRRLLTSADLGQGYTEVPDSGKQRSDVGITGCPALEKLGDSAQDGELAFAVKAKAGFAYTAGSTGNSTLGEELHSDTPAKLSEGTRALFKAYESCPSFTMTSGTTPVKIEIGSASAPSDLGDERYAHTMTVASGASTTVLKQVAVRTGNVVVMLTGAPGLVDAQLPAAVEKARSTG